jgi:RNA polymerase sigma-70 factor, ECF subfamily
MSATSTGTTLEGRLLAQARAGEESAFARVIDPHRRGLQAHCYRMLGSLHDAEDALQETLLRAWRGLSKFEGRSSLRSWLYTIATNTCLNLIARRPKRVLPIDYGPATDPHVKPGEPVTESVWIEPYPDELLPAPGEQDAPAARYELRESVELAFVAALQHLSPLQRAVLLQREVLGFSAREAADSLQTTVPAINSALQRARAAIDQRTPERSQQATLDALGEEALRELVMRYVDAWERCDVQAFAAMLARDASFTMPPLSTWYEGRSAIARWAQGSPLSGDWRWRAVRTGANAQPALGYYAWNVGDGNYRPFALNVLSFEGDLVSGVTAFIARSSAPRERDAFARYPDEPLDAGKVANIFTSFGLPAQLN